MSPLKRSRGGAYVFILVVAALLFMIASSAIAITAPGRLVSARYPAYSNLYGLAVSMNERAFFILRETIESNGSEFDEKARAKILDEKIKERLVFEGGEFKLAHPSSRCYVLEYISLCYESFEETLRGEFIFSGGSYAAEWEIAVSLAGDSPIAEHYSGNTKLTRRAGGYDASTEARKELNGTTGSPVFVEASIKWPAGSHEEVLVPSYMWREKPEYFARCLNAAGTVYVEEADGGRVLPDGGSYVVNAFIPDFFGAAGLLEDLSLAGERSIVFAGPLLDVSALATGDYAVISEGPLELFASDGSRNAFSGVIVCGGDLSVKGVSINGSAIVRRDIVFLGEAAFEYDADVMFRLPLAESSKRLLFDFLKLTNFFGASSNAETVLGFLDFDVFGINGTPCGLIVNNFDDLTPVMVESMRTF